MPEKVYFLAGVYGVGKTTLGKRIKEKMRIDVISASDLISNKNGEKFGSNKIVEDENKNQDILVEEVKKINYADEIVLNGHFCIFDKNNDVIQLPLDTYYKLGIKGIIILERDAKDLVRGLQYRDGKAYPEEKILCLQTKEKEVANKIAELMHIPLYIYKMKFNEEDIKEIILILNRVRGMKE